MEEPNGAKKNLRRCSFAAFAHIFSSVSAKKSEQTSAALFAQIFVIEVVRSVINLLLLLLYSTKGAISMHALLLCQTAWVGRGQPVGGRLHSAHRSTTQHSPHDVSNACCRIGFCSLEATLSRPTLPLLPLADRLRLSVELDG